MEEITLCHGAYESFDDEAEVHASVANIMGSFEVVKDNSLKEGGLLAGAGFSRACARAVGIGFQSRVNALPAGGRKKNLEAKKKPACASVCCVGGNNGSQSKKKPAYCCCDKFLQCNLLLEP